MCFGNFLKFVSSSLPMEEFFLSKVTDSTFLKHIIIMYHSKIQKYFPAYNILDFKILSKMFLLELVIIWLCSAVMRISGFPYFPLLLKFSNKTPRQSFWTLSRRVYRKLFHFESIWIYACFQYNTWFHAANVVFITVITLNRIHVENDD